MKYILALCLLTLSINTSHSQERTANGSLQTQMQWNALQNLIEKTNGDLKIVQADVTAIKTCSSKGMLHAPGTTDADTQGCIKPSSSSFSHFDILYTATEMNCTQRVALANTYVGHKNKTDYQGIPYSGTLIGTEGDWIIQSGDGDCSPMSNKARWPIMVPIGTDGKPIKNYYRVVK